MSKIQKLELTWVGKNEQEEIEPRILVENPELSHIYETAANGQVKMINDDGTFDNMLIHGDNLLALKALEQDFAGQVKCIYIDPPFNTGAAFEHYDDNQEHSIWLNLMRQRFLILHSLLSEDGAIYVNLDDSEAAYCKVIMDEIFGRNNYLNEIIVATNKSFGFKSTSDGIFKQANHLLFYAKDRQKLMLNTDKLFIEKGYDEQYKFEFYNTDKPESEWKWRNINDIVAQKLGYSSSGEAKKKCGDDFLNEVATYAIENADKVFRTASVGGGALLKRKETIALSKQDKTKIYRHPNDDMDYMFIGGERVIFYKERLQKIDNVFVPAELITDIWLDISVEGLASEGGIDFPKGKKPEKLLQRCIELVSNEGDIVLDSFLGSGTTCAVAHKMNRKWIGIELGEQAYTHSKKRLDSVIQGTDKTGISKAVNWQGGGSYRFYELAPSLVVKDKYGKEIINPEYNANMLAAAMAKHEGFKYSPDKENVYKQGFASEKSFIFTTTTHLTAEYLDEIAGHFADDEFLVINCKSFDGNISNNYKNIKIKKIPQSILGKCVFGKDNYNLNIINLPTEEGADEEN